MLKFDLKRILCIPLLCLLAAGCVKLFDDTFQLYYSGVSDIAPSTDVVLHPSYKGEKPTDFAIYSITRDGAEVQTKCFSIDSTSGDFHASGTADLPLGLYKISISCTSGGWPYFFDDAITFNLMRSVPDSAACTPSLLQMELADILSGAELPTSQIKVSSGSVPVKGYSITQVRLEGVASEDYKDFFEVSETGVVSVVTGTQDFIPGKYSLDIKVNTYISGEDAKDGTFTDILTVDVTSKPLALKYAKDEVEVESGYEIKSGVPEVTGSRDGLTFEISAKSNPDMNVQIDAATGELTASAVGLLPGAECKVSVKVTNGYGSEEFADIYTVKVIDYVAPVTVFSYDDKTDAIEAVAFEVKVKEVDGDALTFAFEDLPEALSELKIDSETGTISAPDENSIPKGSYTVKVTASNFKGSMTATFTLTVNANPNMFSYVSWGNNLDLTPVKDYASQYQLTSASADVTVNSSDIPAGRTVVYALKSSSSSVSATVDAATGEIVLSMLNGGNVGVVVVSVTVSDGSEDDPAAVSRNFPVFFRCPADVDGVSIIYKPFAIRVNPKAGGSSAAPQITGAELSSFSLDFRRTFTWYNVNGSDSYDDGAMSKTTPNNLLYDLWTSYYTGLSKTPNYGSKDPVSYFSNSDNLTSALCYTSQTDFSLVVNPEKWKTSDGMYADGVFFAQMTFVRNSTGDGINSGKQIFPIAVWFDTTK